MTPQELIDELKRDGLRIDAHFVPYSLAPPQLQDGKRWECFNWTLRVTFNGRTLTTDYRQGTGCIPDGIKNRLSREGFHGRHSVDSRKMMDRLLETGECLAGSPAHLKLPPPSAADVLYCLLSDGEAIEHASFEEWAQSCGYDTDSRTAEKMYRDCLDIGLKLKAMFGDRLASMREAFQDY